MITQTSVTAIRLLIYLQRETRGEVAAIKSIAQALDESPTYLNKIARHLVKAGILRAHRGQAGGVVLNRGPKDIHLLDVLTACQGTLHGTFCQDADDASQACAMHQAAVELIQAMTAVLTRWTLEDFCRRPCPGHELRGQVNCLLTGGRPGVILPR